MADSVYKKDKNYYPQVFFDECKYVVKDENKSKFITNDISADYSDEENSDEENSNEKN